MEAMAERGITAATVSRAVGSGDVERLSRGTYRSPRASAVGCSDLALVAARAPRGVVCLLSAAGLHGLGDVIPDEVWLAIPNNGRPPRIDWPRVRAVRWRSPAALTLGVEDRVMSGVTDMVTNPARTVLDMLRMRSTVGEDRALEALRDFAAGNGSIPEVRAIAGRFGVGRAVAPYLNAFSHMGTRS